MRTKTIEDRIKKIINEKIEDINTFFVGKIIKVDNKKMLADIKIIDMPEKFGIYNEIEIVNNVPIKPFFYNKKIQIYSPFSVNDKVLVCFTKCDNFNSRNSDEAVEPDLTAVFDINNAVIIGNITKDSETIKYENDISIIFENTEIIINETKIVMRGNTNIIGNVEIIGDLKINGNLEVAGNMKIQKIECDELHTKTNIYKNNIPYTHP